MNTSLKWIGGLFFVTVLFPTVALLPLPIQTDTQPNAVLLAGIIFLLGRRIALPIHIWTLLILFICAIFVFFVDGADFAVARSLIGYGSIFLIATAALVLATHDIKLPDKLLDWTVYIWGFVGGMQLFVSHSFMTFLVTASRTTETRGVTALANEPSLYATTLIFFIILYFIRGRERSLPVLFCLVQIVLFSQSALGILFVLMMIGLYVLLRLSAPVAIVTIMVLIGISAFVAFNSNELLAGTRVGALLTDAMRSPMKVLQLDASVSSRVSNIFYSLKGAVEGLMVPHGFNAWQLYAHHQDQIYKGILYRDPGNTRIMSGYGSVLFEMGIAGMIIPVLITIGAIKTFRRTELSRGVAILLVIHLLMLTPVTLAFPLVGFLIGELFIVALPGHKYPGFVSQPLQIGIMPQPSEA